MNLFRNFISYQIQQALFKQNRTESETPPTEEELAEIAEYEAGLTARLLDEVYLECSTRDIPFVLLNIPTTVHETRSVHSNLPLDRMNYADSLEYVDAADIVREFVGERQIQWEKWHGHWLPWVHHEVGAVLADRIAPYVARQSRMRESNELTSQDP